MVNKKQFKKLGLFKKAEDMILHNLVTLVLVIIICFALFSGCSRLYSRMNPSGLELFKEDIKVVFSLQSEYAKPLSFTIDSNSIVVFWNAGTNKVEFTLSDDKKYVLIRPESCLGNDRTCMCYLNNFDINTGIYKEYYCELTDYTISEQSKYLTAEVFLDSKKLDAKKLKYKEELNSLSPISEDIFNQNGLGFFLIKSNIIKVYRQNNVLSFCYLPQRCDKMISGLSNSVDLPSP